MSSQIRSFISYLRSQRTFDILMSPLSISLSFFSRIRIPKTRITASFVAFLNFITSIIIPKMTVQIEAFRSLMDMRGTTFNIKAVSISTILNTLVQFFSNITIPEIYVNSILRTLDSVREFSAVIPKISILISAIVVYFYRLSDHDGSTLGTMDAQTLRSLDYNES